MVRNDILRFEQGMNGVMLDSEHPGKSIFSDSDFDDRECNFPPGEGRILKGLSFLLYQFMMTSLTIRQ